MTDDSADPAERQSSPAPSPDGEEILVLYGSQTGNSESAAQEIEALVPFHLVQPAPCRSRCMQLDDFLEVEKAQWTRLVIIVCSSYGVGQAPLGARKFRELCDAILERQKNNDFVDKDKKFLRGVGFALLGLGDSHYTTFFQNPTAINDALIAAGATRVGELGKADASGTGNDEQSKVIDRWIEGVWNDLAKVIATERPPAQEVLDGAKEGTWGMCLKLFPEWNEKKSSAGMLVAAGGVVLAIGAYLFVKMEGAI
mmetsp:Transcript_31064/g.66118  ORF Transcript_31064/g.66118 Transcript_31064/m.66118 type:complete len:255 (+) Transcript_31064:37-801(+)|eukprot:CAMPEP_0172532198 /NCGR_PEP_ID=MMETSP1067-20121228/5335_1 /TAXON_ID=265564 ORGANISM="Thalassiosira punctigera, Strain Tpunct2005C2" /NCGR_SAMPLE_ID=MMETSP1067 /ASSEMBLY_ACC=CAM_ASM_000444 /LENGTH=254 /DNA_ID=CAMNT_0013316679 /DNA_START=39 /DNA_END=803 /DNA_ORIENTATION=+